ncbi:hypothetical protein EON67_00280 [archaeon]|nr:MAG: hypothetical protein EON67_00280 [archaeon]
MRAARAMHDADIQDCGWLRLCASRRAAPRCAAHHRAHPPEQIRVCKSRVRPCAALVHALTKEVLLFPGHAHHWCDTVSAAASEACCVAGGKLITIVRLHEARV